MGIKTLIKKISNSGVRQSLSSEEAEKVKLVNTISFLGVPICSTYAVVFGVTEHYFHAVLFLFGLLIFILPPFLNAWKGLKVSVSVFTVSTPLFWAILTITAGKETGFYLGFIIFCIGPMLFFRTLKESLFYVWVGIVLFIVSIIGVVLLPPVDTFPYAMWIFMVNLFTVLFTIVIVVYLFKQEADESKTKIQEKNREILDSINYAKRIQNAMLPIESSFQNKFKEYFIQYKPKDIVAGDFYWMEEVDGKILVAAADCTGHGVPGALVSLVCYNALNKAVFEYKLTDPGKILDMTRQFVVEHFSKTEEKVKDGMDISLVAIDKATGEIIWAGANNPLWYMQNGEWKAIMANKQPVGISEKSASFTSHKIKLAPNDCIYLFTDGYADQFGGKKGKKFMYKQLKELLLSKSSLTMADQKQVLNAAIEEWMGDLEQVDDILVIGIRI